MVEACESLKKGVLVATCHPCWQTSLNCMIGAERNIGILGNTNPLGSLAINGASFDDESCKWMASSTCFMPVQKPTTNNTRRVSKCDMFALGGPLPPNDAPWLTSPGSHRRLDFKLLGGDCVTLAIFWRGNNTWNKKRHLECTTCTSGPNIKCRGWCHHKLNHLAHAVP